jgi:hypothetical protein
MESQWPFYATAPRVDEKSPVIENVYLQRGKYREMVIFACNNIAAQHFLTVVGRYSAGWLIGCGAGSS